MAHNILENIDVKSVLIFNTERLGDSIMSLPTLLAFAHKYKYAKKVLITDVATYSLYKELNIFDYIYSFKYKSKNIKEYVRLMKKIRPHKIDIGLILTGGFFAGLISFGGGIKNRVGLKSDGRGIFINHKIKPIKDDRHQVYHYLDLLKPVGIEDIDVIPKLNITRTNKNILKINESAQDKKTIAIAMFTKDDVNKMYPLDKWEELISRLSDAYNIVLLGSKDESKKYRTFLDNLKSGYDNIYDTVGSFSLDIVMKLIKECDIYIGNDSGLTHLSSALGVKSIVLFGGTNKDKTKPLGECVHIIQSKTMTMSGIEINEILKLI